jgi:four helix bundle protein
MTPEEWETQVPEWIKADPVWRHRVYRLALFLSDLAWHDATKLMQDRRTVSLSDQLYRSIGGIGSQFVEGYSRSSGKDQARFYEYALGSARESRDWYYKGRHVLGETVLAHRAQLATEIIRLLLKIIPEQRTAAPVRRVDDEQVL